MKDEIRWSHLLEERKEADCLLQSADEEVGFVMMNAKRAAAIKAAEFVEDGMRLGLGSGSTVRFFIDALIKRCQEGLKVTAACSSIMTRQMAEEGGIKMIDDFVSLDLTIDGADEIDPQKRMIKGGGGALLREKIIASSSIEMIVIVDESKCVEQLGKAKLPVEVACFGSMATAEKIPFKGAFRMKDEGLYTTDNGNYIYDISFNGNPEDVDTQLRFIPGVLETGFFFSLAGRVVVGHSDETVEVIL